VPSLALVQHIGRIGYRLAALCLLSAAARARVKTRNFPLFSLH
jgi:hypothetical protein